MMSDKAKTTRDPGAGPGKDPDMAMLLSAVIPGAGQVYSGRPFIWVLLAVGFLPVWALIAWSLPSPTLHVGWKAAFVGVGLAAWGANVLHARSAAVQAGKEAPGRPGQPDESATDPAMTALAVFVTNGLYFFYLVWSLANRLGGTPAGSAAARMKAFSVVFFAGLAALSLLAAVLLVEWVGNLTITPFEPGVLALAWVLTAAVVIAGVLLGRGAFMDAARNAGNGLAEVASLIPWMVVPVAGLVAMAMGALRIRRVLELR